jgi:type VI secretion system protein ImpM
MSGPVGFYGKLPGAGDFVQRRLPSAFVEGWDRHFQRAVETGRRELGAQWTAAWRHGAAWRFVLPAQVCGNGAWCGLVGPAEDRLGRGFPMVLAAPCTGDVAGIVGNGEWFDALERVYLRALYEAVSVETFDARVAALPHPLANAAGAAALWRGVDWDSGQWQFAVPQGAAAGALLAQAWDQLGLRPGAWCLWWTQGAARLLATRGLPRSYAALLETASVPGQDGVAAALDGSNSAHEPASGEAAPSTATAWQPVQTAPSGLPETAAAPRDACQSGADHSETQHAALPEPSAALAGATLLQLDHGRTLLLSADDGPADPRRRAALSIRAAALASAPDLSSLQATLLALHAPLRNVNQRSAGLAPEDGAALVARYEAGQLRLLRIGAAAAWHWRHGQLRPLFVERAAGAGGEFDDLLFGDAWLAMPGLGAAEVPHCDEASGDLEAGDRLLLLVTRGLTQLPPQCFADALGLPTCNDARAHLAACAGLGADPAQWPLAVLGADA